MIHSYYTYYQPYLNDLKRVNLMTYDPYNLTSIVLRLSEINDSQYQAISGLIRCVKSRWDAKYTKATQKTKFCELKTKINKAFEEGQITEKVHMIALSQLKLSSVDYAAISEKYNASKVEKQSNVVCYGYMDTRDFVDDCVELISQVSRFKRLIGLCGLTGRRPYEVAKKGRLTLLDKSDPLYKTHVLFEGQAKTGSIKQNIFNSAGELILDKTGQPVEVLTEIKRDAYIIPVLLKGRVNELTVEEVVDDFNNLNNEFSEAVEHMTFQQFNNYSTDCRKHIKKYFKEFEEQAIEKGQVVTKKFNVKSLRKYYVCACKANFKKKRKLNNKDVIIGDMEYVSNLLGHKRVSENTEEMMISHDYWNEEGQKVPAFKYRLKEESAYLNVDAYLLFDVEPDPELK